MYILKNEPKLPGRGSAMLLLNICSALSQKIFTITKYTVGQKSLFFSFLPKRLKTSKKERTLPNNALYVRLFFSPLFWGEVGVF